MRNAGERRTGRSRITVGALLLGLCLAAPGASAQESAGSPVLGATAWVGNYPFQYLGRDAAGRELWLYPHPDGVPELFRVRADGLWEGALDSRYDPERGRFARRFSAAEVLNELLDAKPGGKRGRRAAKLLALFAALHPAGQLPYYLQPAWERIQKRLRPDDAGELDALLAETRAILARVPELGTRIFPEPTRLLDARDHYRSLVADGYLDVAVVGGNSYDEETGKYYSGPMVAQLSEQLGALGFAASAYRGSQDLICREKTARILGRRVRVRVQLTGGSARDSRVRRAVANFVEGLARADLLLYVGHSNHGSGNYYLSEDKTGFSRFKVGLEHQGRDLARKCHATGRKRHQILALQSCSSYWKYCLPMTSHYEAGDDEPRALPGFLGTTRVAYFEEFAPRFAAMIELLMAGAGPRRIAAELNAIRPRPDAAELIVRGVLQPRRSFIMPDGVQVGEVRELGPETGHLVVGRGSDGRDYASTEVFPQDRAGEIVQVVARERTLYGLGRDGRLYRVGPRTVGLMAALPATEHPLVFVGLARRKRRERLYVVDARGRIATVGDEPPRFSQPKYPAPRGVRFVAVGNDARGAFLALDAEGHTYARRHQRWRRLTQPEELVSASPSLLGKGSPGTLLVAGEPVATR